MVLMRDGDGYTLQGQTIPDRDAAIDSKIATHAGNASAHHAKTGDNEVYGKVLVDLAANRPAAGIAGRWFIASDTLAISYDDGSAWTTVGTLGGQDVSDYSSHKADASAHHAKTTDAGDITSGTFAVDRLPNLTQGKIWSGDASNRPTETDMPSGLTFTELAGGEDKTVATANTWEDWDISAIVPAGTVAVLVLIVSIGGAATSGSAGARKNGSALARLHDVNTTTASAERSATCILTEVDANRIIEIYAPDTSKYQFNIVGYWS